MSNQSRRTVAAPDAPVGVRPGAGVLGLARSEAAAKAPAEEPSSQGTLIVGEGIHVKGEIQSCTTLIVEGRVEASLEAAELSVREGGLYDGKAVVDTARIGGDFTGELTVRGLLTVAAGGRVSGTLRYGELQIEQGGRISGDVDLLAGEAAAAETTRKVDPRDAALAVSKAQAQAQNQPQNQAQNQAGNQAGNQAASERRREGAAAR